MTSCAPTSAIAFAPKALDEALTIVRARRGIDFSGYRRGTLERRLLNRLIAVRASGAASYLATLRESEAEIDALVATLTVKMSRLYRNAAVFDALRDLLDDLRPRVAPTPLRVWSAGCGRGEEAYTLAMLLDGQPATVRATDVDARALAAARTGRYAPEAFAELPPALARFTEAPSGARQWAVSPHLRDRIRFERHDLLMEEPPDARGFHLVCCRNVLIYFEARLQRRALRTLIRSVVPGGLLCLGEAEWLGEDGMAMEVVDRRLKIFRRRPLTDEPR